MFLSKKSLIIANQKRAIEQINILRKDVFKEVENIINDEELTLEEQDSENNGVFKKAYQRILSKKLKIWEN